MIVADTGPIIAFLQIGHLDLLRQVIGSVIIPTAVYKELTLQRGEFTSRSCGAESMDSTKDSDKPGHARTVPYTAPPWGARG
jgi:hypothetical protein